MIANLPSWSKKRWSNVIAALASSDFVYKKLTSVTRMRMSCMLTPARMDSGYGLRPSLSSGLRDIITIDTSASR